MLRIQILDGSTDTYPQWFSPWGIATYSFLLFLSPFNISFASLHHLEIEKFLVLLLEGVSNRLGAIGRCRRRLYKQFCHFQTNKPSQELILSFFFFCIDRGAGLVVIRPSISKSFNPERYSFLAFFLLSRMVLRPVTVIVVITEAATIITIIC